MGRTRKAPWRARMLAATCGAVVVAMAASGVAYASPTSTSPAVTPQSLSLRQLTLYTVQADLVMHTRNGYRSYEVDRGHLTSLTTREITIRCPDGPSVAATITRSTKFFGRPFLGLALRDRIVLVKSRGNALDVYVTFPHTTTTSGSTTPVSTVGAWRQELTQLMRRTVHAGLVVPASPGYQWVRIDRGHLTSVTPAEITIRRPDGPSVATMIVTSTEFFGLPLSGLVVGDHIVIVQTGGGNAIDVYSSAPKPVTSSG